MCLVRINKISNVYMLEFFLPFWIDEKVFYDIDFLFCYHINNAKQGLMIRPKI